MQQLEQGPRPNNLHIRYDRSRWPRWRDELLASVWLQEEPRLTLREMGKIVHVRARVLHSHAVDTLGLPLRGPRIPVWTPDKDTLLAELRQQTDPYLLNSEIGKKLGVSDQAAQDRASFLSLPPRPPRPNQRFLIDPSLRASLTHMWNVKGLTASEISRRLDVPRGTVCRAAREWDLKYRAPRKGKAKGEHSKPPRRQPSANPDFALSAFSELPANDNACMWPHGDPMKPGFSFCGCKIPSGLTYCDDHAAIAYGRAA